VHGHGRCAITLDPQDKLPGQQPYQGIVPLSDENGPLESMAAVLEHYMQASEQLDTRLWLASNEQVAAGMLLQKLPSYGGTMEAQVGETGSPLSVMAGAGPGYLGSRVPVGRHAQAGRTAGRVA
jgi:molecular chaperone Hsp33